MNVDLPENLKALSDEEKWVAGSWFAMMKPGNGELVFNTPSKVEPWAWECLQSLVARGMLAADVPAPGSIRYVPQTDFFPLLGWGLQRGADPIGKRALIRNNEPPKSITLSMGQVRPDRKAHRRNSASH